VHEVTLDKSVEQSSILSRRAQPLAISHVTNMATPIGSSAVARGKWLLNSRSTPPRPSK
jgi:hypothetical protein